MKVLKSKRNGNTINLEVEASHEELESKFDGAFKKVSKKASLPGFRKGKIPRNIFEKNFGKDVIIQEAIYDVVNDTYKSAIEELKLKKKLSQRRALTLYKCLLQNCTEKNELIHEFQKVISLLAVQHISIHLLAYLKTS